MSIPGSSSDDICSHAGRNYATNMPSGARNSPTWHLKLKVHPDSYQGHFSCLSVSEVESHDRQQPWKASTLLTLNLAFSNLNLEENKNNPQKEGLVLRKDQVVVPEGVHITLNLQEKQKCPQSFCLTKIGRS